MLATFILASTPPVGWLLVVLALYTLVAIPLVFWGLGRTGKRGLAWAILPILASIATSCLWWYVNRQVRR
ncbi:MAG: hypothetical protein JST73_01785 [Actinobacteria bacterium]|nr:hypothetical protein [Actinomycetota bacterium]